MSQLNPILPLSRDTRRRLRASFIITDVPQAVEELVCNSIDAEATDISVHLDLSRFTFAVHDNGTSFLALRRFAADDKRVLFLLSLNSKIALH